MGFIKKKNIRSWAKEFSGEFFIYEPKTVQEVNKILQLEDSDYHVSVLLALGKRAEGDQNQHLKKVRLETSVLFETI